MSVCASRRQVCAAMAAGLLALRCGGGSPVSGEKMDSGAPTPLDCDPPAIDPSDPSWVELPLAEHPALAMVGGAAAISLPAHLLELVVAQPTAGCWFAVWRICTHGACEVTWEAAARQLLCPCHHSRFGEDGSVAVGPATEPLRAFPVGRLGESLWVYRPL
jgi:Rieske Fe-S protein